MGMYIAKFPIIVQYKKHNHEKYTTDQFKNGNAYAYLRFKGNRIVFEVLYSDMRQSYKITIPKWYVYQMMLYHLQLRPITRWYTGNGCDNLWLHHNIRKVKKFDILNTNPDDVKKDYDDAVKNMRTLIPYMTGRSKYEAERELDKLLNMEWIISLLTQITKCKNYEFKADEKYIHKLE